MICDMKYLETLRLVQYGAQHCSREYGGTVRGTEGQDADLFGPREYNCVFAVQLTEDNPF